jgi:hypothetical protein
VPAEIVELQLARRDGKLIDARIEIMDDAVVLHSRGGATGGRPARNTDYSEAIDIILERLGAETGIERVLVDSAEARAMPEAQRIIAVKEDFQKLPLKELKNQIRREMRALGRPKDAPANQGNSTKRLRFETSGSASQLRRILRAFPTAGDEQHSGPNPPGGGSGGNGTSKGNRQPTVDEVDAAIAEIPLTDEERTWIEGSPKVARHLRRERQPGLAKAKKDDFKARHGHLFCERCQMDPAKVYGSETALACIEVHHAKVHVAEMDEGHETVLDDLECLCANCHRILHREMALAKKQGQASSDRHI